MGWKLYGNALHVLELLCKSKSMPKNIFKSQQKQKKSREKSVVHRSAASIPPESLLVVKMTRTRSRLAESESASFRRSSESLNHWSIIECTVKVEKPCSLPQAWDLISAQPCLVLKHILVSILSHCLFIKTQALFSTWLRSIKSVPLLGAQSLL